MRKSSVVILACLLLFSIQTYAAVKIKLFGATTVADLIKSYKSEVEKITGTLIEINAHSAGMGLIYLSEGKCDICLTATSIENTVKAAQAGMKNISPEGLKLTVIKNDKLIFVVNANNPVESLTVEQLKNIYVGRITNWSDVGGPNLPITVISDRPTGATRAIIQESVLNKESFTPAARIIPNHDRIAIEVGLTPGACAGISQMYLTKNIKTIKTQISPSRLMSFITKGEPEGDIKKVIDAFTEVLNKDSTQQKSLPQP